jgi:hypothetical protein
MAFHEQQSAGRNAPLLIFDVFLLEMNIPIQILASLMRANSWDEAGVLKFSLQLLQRGVLVATFRTEAFEPFEAGDRWWQGPLLSVGMTQRLLNKGVRHSDNKSENGDVDGSEGSDGSVL